jgi:uncharacterized protein YdeI (BOF family)
MEHEKRPYFKRMIKDVKKKDTHVQIVGKITDKISDKEYKFSDDTGEITLLINPANPPIEGKIRTNMIAKVFGEFTNEKKDCLNVKIMTDYSDLNFDLYKKSYNLAKKYLPQN